MIFASFQTSIKRKDEPELTIRSRQPTDRIGCECYLLVFNSISHSFARVLKISEHSPKISEDSRKFSEDYVNISDHFPKMSIDCRRLPNISEQSSKMFRSYRNKFRFVQQLNLVYLIARMMSLIFHT